MYAIITPDGLVKNNIYGYENCDISILSSPKLGASFVDYIITVHKAGKNIKGIGNETDEVFLFVISGSLKVYNNDEETILETGGFFYSRAGQKLYFENISEVSAKILLYKRKYKRLENFEPKTIYGNIENIISINSAFTAFKDNTNGADDVFNDPNISSLELNRTNPKTLISDKYTNANGRERTLNDIEVTTSAYVGGNNIELIKDRIITMTMVNDYVNSLPFNEIPTDSNVPYIEIVDGQILVSIGKQQAV